MRTTFDQLFNPQLSYEDWKGLFDTFDKDAISQYYERYPKFNLFKEFGVLFRQKRDNTKKLKYIFKRYKKGDIPLGPFDQDSASPYRCSIIHLLIANEDFEWLALVLNLIETYEVDSDFNTIDVEGKSVLLTAIKVPSTPTDIIYKFITPETIKIADQNGVTPLMLAVALSRLDIVNAILECAK